MSALLYVLPSLLPGTKTISTSVTVFSPSPLLRKGVSVLLDESVLDILTCYCRSKGDSRIGLPYSP